MSSTVEDSIRSLWATCQHTSRLNFTVRETITQAALASADEFETRYIREADTAEAFLFQPSALPSAYQALLVNHSTTTQDTSDENQAKARVTRQPPAGDAAATRSSLMAIQKLLEVYPMPRLRDHVKALVRQLDTLEASISGLQNELQLVKRLPPQAKLQVKKITQSQPSAQLTETIQRESLEVLALTDLRDEKRAESRKLSDLIARTEIKHSSKKAKLCDQIKPSGSSVVDTRDPFILSRTESIRRCIQRAKSPRNRVLHSVNMEYGDEPFVSYGQLGSASMQDMVSDDDANLPSTPTPKSMNQKRLEKSLTKLKLLTPYGSRVEGKPLIDSCKPSQRVSSGPVHEPPKEPIDVLKPASTSLQKPMAIEDVQPTETPSASLQIPASEPELPTSRLDCISRLIKSFWKSSTVLDALRSANPGLDTILENSEDTRGYLQHIDALDRLMKSFSSGAESLLTPNQLIEASFYQELLKSFCQSTENSEDVLPCVLHQDQWCVPLEMMKQKLVKICQTHNFNSSINTTVIYLLVGKMVVKIDRRATPILICVC